MKPEPFRLYRSSQAFTYEFDLHARCSTSANSLAVLPKFDRLWGTLNRQAGHCSHKACAPERRRESTDRETYRPDTI